MQHKIFVAGVGMTKFAKPDWSDPYTLMGVAAIRAVLEDSGLNYTAVHRAYAGYEYSDSTCGQNVTYKVGHAMLARVRGMRPCRFWVWKK